MTTPGALNGIVVADFSRVLAGPYATMMLADLGAEVIKIERPGSGDDTRSWGPPFDSDGQATYFNAVNRNKRSVVLDLHSPDGVEQAREIVRGADIVVENFRTGTMERMGLGYADLVEHRPDVIYCAITGFGSGQGADLPGYDLLVQAVGGLMSVTGPHPGEPTKVGVALVDVLAGLHAATGILAALQHRNGTGQGQKIEVNLLSTLLSSLVNQASGYLGAGAVPGIMGNRHPSIAPYEVFSTADRPLVLAVGNDKQFRALCKALGAESLADSPDYADNTSRVANREALFTALTERLRTRGSDEWFTVLTAAGVPVGPINDISQAFELAKRLELDAVVDVPGSSAPQVANPIKMSATPVQYRSAPPRLGS
ncbi:L-carnitine dehydratase/bile acid-inducible protein F [Mycolicibacterium mageritense DSM 44476 = CIP 104973]|uniref:CoA transferase n=1 Tax=Mycolicibacterium mageritense TaxID=53462 RepID=A0ABM7HKX6_MYCME|nr:CoA transferase [Mycolicibacterium mageritense]MCC9180903.1 CoA transferase [Mycolicibacterium mageritense]BBX31129.1 CoA transferase [Mycolicibacterium mageritense]CDO24878.1 L-carnitine dehydratase/bile acid-inducible protein F [Mycolicibacterium mageritense DSM 44476 = CIP 104973]